MLLNSISRTGKQVARSRDEYIKHNPRLEVLLFSLIYIATGPMARHELPEGFGVSVTNAKMVTIAKNISRMLSWIADSPSRARVTEQLQVLNDLKRCHNTKVVPIEEDFSFKLVYPVANFAENANPLVAIITCDDTVRSACLDLLLGVSSDGSDVPVLFRDSMSGGSSGSDMTEKIETGSRENRDFVLNPKPNHPVLRQMSVLDIPAQCTTIDTKLIEQATVIYLVLSDSESDISPQMKRLVSKMRSLHDRFKLIVLTNESSPLNLLQLVWGLAKSINLPEMPRTFLVGREECGRAELFSDLMNVPLAFAFNHLQLLLREARLARAHALLFSHIKSQLPAFNRQQKLDRLTDDLEEVVKSISSKTGVPITDFPSSEFIRDTVRKFDFSGLKKLKESNLELVSDFIENDYKRILSKFPKELFPLLQPMHEKELKMVPDPAEFNEAFQSLNPINGVVSGAKLKDHLLSVSQLSSHMLHRIWKRSDVDKDGALNLKEYAMCRALIKHVQDGHNL